MDTLSLRQSLNSMWPLLFAATQRHLATDELAELRRLADLVNRGIPGRDAFNAGAAALCESVFSSGLFESSHEAGLLETLLQETDELRRMLD